MRYTRQSLLRMAHEMDSEWEIFDLIYYWQECNYWHECGCKNMYKLFRNKMSKRDVLWVMDKCFQEIGEGQFNDNMLIRLHRNAYMALAERLERR